MKGTEPFLGGLGSHRSLSLPLIRAVSQFLTPEEKKEKLQKIGQIKS